ncbi:LLM class flavin-dependent oxidoreductase [Nocardia farcinica]|uniref:LLM class flavin-dependent oxidoreductase n=1 Tax=Nocardia farcinica TaxID=37329 RepID=UPI0018956D73|nr:LLM class flavin-dependent oxidoreductase [Nocardia farcinica]MBF6142080.1 LLM class flavin-dependent oxidoreductase [Nocardia farcinica]MBF6385453.1 LLM class flavin-dependent oxidoreductase [Nocardia farcinica]MBF6537876.1 LLM class flavin-dependent oxidoreductase [Nocardia farcinica]
MTAFLWRLPTRGDGRRARPESRHRGGFGGPPPTTPATDPRPGRYGPFDDLAQIVDAAELAGLDGVLAPYDPLGEESWIVAGGALRATRYATVVVEFEPGFGTPVYAAKMSATLQRLSRGRLAWRLAVDTDAAQAAARGDTVTGVDRYARAAEFLTVARGVWNAEPVPGSGFDGTGFDFDGDHFHVIDGGFRGILSGLPFPQVQLSGDAPEALDLSARHGDLHVFAESARGPAAALAELRDRAAAVGRTVRAGLELPVVARQTEREAWARVHRQWRETGRDIAEARALDLGDGRWAGFAAFGYPHPVGLVGSYEQVAARLRDYAAAGIDTVVLGGHPHIEEVHRAGEHLLHLADPAGRTLTGAEEVPA